MRRQQWNAPIGEMIGSSRSPVLSSKPIHTRSMEGPRTHTDPVHTRSVEGESSNPYTHGAWREGGRTKKERRERGEEMGEMRERHTTGRKTERDRERRTDRERDLRWKRWID